MVDLEHELQRGTDLFLSDLLQLADGEDLLIYADQSTDSRVVEALLAKAARAGRRVELLALDIAQPLAEQGAQLTERIRSGGFRAVCELTARSFYMTEAWEAVRVSDGRAYSLAGLDAAAFIRCIARVDHARMYALGMALRARLLGARRLEIRSANGTELRMQLGTGPLGRLYARLRQRRRAFVLHPSGYRGGFLGGQLAFRGIPYTIEGTAVVDGYLWPPDTLGRLTQPMVLTFEAGALVEIGGSATAAEQLARWLEGVTARVEHVCLGFNPGACLDGGIMEAERTFGCITIGMGRGERHTDAVLREASIDIDGCVLQEGGVLMPPELAALALPLISAGHAEGSSAE